MKIRNQELLDNLTFEDFDRYANRKPDFDGNWIYKVEQALFISDASRPR